MILHMVRVRTQKRPKKKIGAHPARGPKWDRKIFRRCIRRKPHTNPGPPLGTRSPCYGRHPKPTLPRPEGECAIKVSMQNQDAETHPFIAWLADAHGPCPDSEMRTFSVKRFGSFSTYSSSVYIATLNATRLVH